jgi:UDPglucose 6-dehydrogenase
VWGAAFKPGTDDARDSAALQVANQLRTLGAEVTVYDLMASGNITRVVTRGSITGVEHLAGGGR